MKFEEKGQLAVVPELVSFLDGDRPDWTRALLRTIGGRIESMPPDRWTALTEPIKTAWAEQRYRTRFDTKQYERIVKVCRDSPGLLTTLNRLAIFHFDGFVREAAITALAGLQDGSELSCLLCRLNDWVAPVREAARRSVLQRLKPEYAEAFAQCLPLLVHVSEGRRADHTAITNGVKPLLLRPEVRNTMLGWLRSADRAVRRATLTALCAGNDPVLLQQAALGSGDPILLRDWLKAAIELSPAESLRTIAVSLTVHPIASLRRDALDVLIAASSDDEADAILKQALLDRSASVRGAARSHSTARGWRDFHQYYRTTLNSGDSTNLAAALSGLGEVGTKADIDEIERFLIFPLPAVRRAALRSLAILAGDIARDTLAEHLRDASPSVSRTASRLLRPYASAVGAKRLWRIYMEASSQHTRRNTLRLLPLASKWDAIAYLLLARCDALDEEKALIEQLIVQWISQFNHDLTTPTPSQRQRAAESLQRCIDSNPHMRSDLLRFLIH